jgi:hypothetical protein
MKFFDFFKPKPNKFLTCWLNKPISRYRLGTAYSLLKKRIPTLQANFRDGKKG